METTLLSTLLGLIILLIVGSYKYTHSSSKSLWGGIEKVRGEFKEEVKELRDNHIKHLEERVTRLESR